MGAYDNPAFRIAGLDKKIKAATDPNSDTNRFGLSNQARNVGMWGQNYWEGLGKQGQGYLGPAAAQAQTNAGQLNQPSAIENYYKQLQGAGSEYFNQARKDSMGNLSQLYAAQGAFGSGANLLANAKAQSNLAAQEEQFMGGLANQATNAQQGRLGESYNQLLGAGQAQTNAGFTAGQGAVGARTEGEMQRLAALMAQLNRGEQVSDQDKAFFYGTIQTLLGGAAKGYFAGAGAGAA